MMQDTRLFLSLGQPGASGQCSDEAWICSLDSSTAVPIGLTPSAWKANHELDGLSILFRDAGYRQSALVEFVCSVETTMHSSTPLYAGERDGTYSFRWSSKDACPIIIPDLPFSAMQEEPNDNNEDGEGEATSPHVSRTRAALTVLIIGLVFLSTCYFIYNPPTRLIDTYLRPHLSRISSRIPHLNLETLPQQIKGLNLNPMSKKSKRRGRSQFRPGENNLVQWAQEDMGLNGDEDVMVNAAEEDDTLLDEYIPLSVGMGWNGRGSIARNYGTARFAQ
ncbi:hypothetical protein VNI00_000174 [Paramarasmius palmivorus]|uniref:Autophagy-related protein 27 n=1 Tax=Paramarasmius palmivorus TaxID=297713 RepID=A0AAW0EC19_9AGAR